MNTWQKEAKADIWDATGKVCLLGPAKSGKSVLLYRFIHEEYKKEYESTTTLEFSTKILRDEQSDKKIKLQIWDTVGKNFRGMNHSVYCQGSVALIITCNVSEKESLEEVLEYWRLIKNHVSVDCPVFLVGTKGDLEQQITPEDLQDLAKDMAAEVSKDSEINVFYWGITSAKTGEGVDNLFAKIASIVAEKIVAKEKKDTLENVDGLSSANSINTDEKEPLKKKSSSYRYSGTSDSTMFPDNSDKRNGVCAFLLALLKCFFLCGCCCPEKEVDYSPGHNFSK